MGKSNGMDAQHETCDYVQMHIFRVPKKNHDTIVQIGKQGHEKKNHDTIVQIGKQGHEVDNKHGILRQESFVLGSTETYEGFTNIANIVFATRDEEIWLHLNF